MTLLELIRGALEQLDRGTDAQTIETWRDKLTRYFNDAVLDLLSTAPLQHTETVTVTDGKFTTASLERTCLKVVAVMARGVRWPFYYGIGTNEICLPKLGSESVIVVYRAAPRELAIDTDVPDVPAPYHGALINYAVARERAMGDEASLSAARACFELYNARKRSLMQSAELFGGSRILNCF